jgi:hypothetical protein
MEVASGWGRLSLQRVVGFGGRVCGGKPSTNEKPRITEWTMCKWESLRGGWTCPCGGLWGGQRTLSRTHEREWMDGVQMGVVSTGFRHSFASQPPAQPNGFGVGGVVPAADCGFRGARLWGKAVHEFFPRINEWKMCKWEWFR